MENLLHPLQLFYLNLCICDSPSYLDTGMKLNTGKITVVFFIRKFTNTRMYKLIEYSQRVTNLRMLLDCKLYFTVISITFFFSFFTRLKIVRRDSICYFFFSVINGLRILRFLCALFLISDFKSKFVAHPLFIPSVYVYLLCQLGTFQVLIFTVFQRLDHQPHEI
jgi:hypothetical protein